MPEYRIGRFRNGFALIYYDEAGKRHRYSLDADNPREAERVAPALFAELTRPKGDTVSDLWEGYCLDKAGRAVIGTMVHTWKALAPRFGQIPGNHITIADCRAHTAERRKAGIKDGTIHTELGHLRTVLVWAERHQLIDRAPYIERPQKPRPSEKHLTREEVWRLFDAATVPHVKLTAVLLYTTAARSSALLGLTWDRCDFEREQIDLRDPTMTAPQRIARTVAFPKTGTLIAALLSPFASARAGR